MFLASAVVGQPPGVQRRQECTELGISATSSDNLLVCNDRELGISATSSDNLLVYNNNKGVQSGISDPSSWPAQLSDNLLVYTDRDLITGSAIRTMPW